MVRTVVLSVVFPSTHQSSTPLIHFSCARSSKRAGGFITRIALDECLDREHYPARVPFGSVVEGVRIDEELARKGPCGLPSLWLTPSRVRISLPPPTLEEVRHRRGHRLESGCRFDLSWVRFPLLPPFSMLRWFAMLPMKILWPIRARSVNGRSRRGDITWCRAARAEPRPCRRAIPARILSTRLGAIMSFGIRSIRWNPFWPTLVFRDFSIGCISSRTRLSSAANAVGHAGQGNTGREIPLRATFLLA